ncbi:MAG: salicylate synthase [Halomonas sp.]|uniref:salicylate synthase n=1 Tax=Halomonas sp. TaxID=1486246 RepID=UPI003F91349A
MAHRVPHTEPVWAEYERLAHWQQSSLGESLKHWVSLYGHATALVEGEQHLSYIELDARVEQLARAFQALGIVSGDRVLVQLPNGLAFIETCFALFRTGALPILAMPAQREKDIEALCQLAEPVAFITKDSFLGFDHAELAAKVAETSGSIRHVIIDGVSDSGNELDEVRQLGHAAAATISDTPSSQDVALLLLSGGTTGTPKLIPRTHADYLYNATASAHLCDLDASSVYLAALPIAHNFPLACPGIIGTLSVGGRVVLAQTPSPDECFELIARERVTFTSLVPPLVQLWIEAREWDDTDLSSLRFLQVGGARCDANLAAKITPALGCSLQQVFGMAEGLLCYTRLDDPLDEILNTQGRPLSPRDEVRLVNEQGEDVAEGEVGELLTRGPYTIREYFRAAAHNVQSFTPDGFYCSGDLARWSVGGNLQVEGRIKQQVNRAGEKIATEEVEEALCRHPEIESAALVGVADSRLGERSCAFLIGSNHALCVSELRTFLMTHGLPAYKCPDQVVFTRHWPLTPLGKIDKQKLAERVMEPSSSSSGFIECVQSINSDPMALAVAFARASADEDHVIYEREGEWLVATGRLATLKVTSDRVSLQEGDAERFWEGRDICRLIAVALGEIETAGWRAYGSASFELADSFHGVPGSSGNVLLELFVPRLEIRLRAGEATLRTTDEHLLTALAAQTATLDQAGGDIFRPSENHLIGMAGLIANHDAEAYRLQVAEAVSDIRAGRYEKVILSRQVPVPEPVDLFATYLHGRRQNTPARSFLVRCSGLNMLGFSPETVVEVDANGGVNTQPLAGTRSMGSSSDERKRLRHELETDVKEIAEHAVSVRLAVDELRPHCLPETVHVSEFMHVRERGSVQHLASRVKGSLSEGRTAWHAFEALFPAVTASGIPKREALQAIRRYEQQPRGPYSGCVLMADCDGSLDAALVLRSLFQRKGKTWLQAGAGIVAQSTPERELEETREKLSSLAHCLIADVAGTHAKPHPALIVDGDIQ